MEDITEHIEQQKAQRMLTAIFEKSTDVVAQLDPQGRLLYLNPAGRAFLGVGLSDALDALHFRNFLPSGRAEQVRREIFPTALEKGIWVGETSVTAHGGSEVTVSEMLIVHRDEKQQIENFSVVMRDISKEQQARVELLRSQSILDIVASSLPVIVAVLDTDVRFLFTNDALDKWAGRPHGSLLGQKMSEALGEEAYEARRPYAEAALRGVRSEFETEQTDRGSPQFLEAVYIPFHGADGNVAGFVALVQDITIHRLQHQKLLNASQTDALTGTLNRAGLDQRFQQALERMRGTQDQLALLCIDLDGFKPVNDQHGHAAGDALLKAVAQRLQRALRPPDLLARLGGDEFAVVLPHIKSTAAAQAVAHKIVSTLGTPFQIGDVSVHIGGSVGVALTADGEDSAQALLQRADEALYQAKRNGRGRFEMADSTKPLPQASGATTAYKPTKKA